MLDTLIASVLAVATILLVIQAPLILRWMDRKR